MFLFYFYFFFIVVVVVVVVVCVVKRKLYDRVFVRYQRYQGHRAEIDGYTDTFKRSTSKKDPNLEMLPTNLHSQLLRVEDSSGSVYTYETLTLGCPAAHSIGFKNGGLGAMKREMNQVRPKRVLDVSKYKDKLVELAAGFAEWKEAVSRSKDDSEALDGAVEGLRCMVDEMVALFRHKDILKVCFLPHVAILSFTTPSSCHGVGDLTFSCCCCCCCCCCSPFCHAALVCAPGSGACTGLKVSAG